MKPVRSDKTGQPALLETGSPLERHDRRESARRRRLIRLLGLGVLLLLLCGLMELGARVYWKTRGVPLWGACEKLHWAFYPELGEIERTPVDPEGDTVEILLLGGSALSSRYGNIEYVLHEELSRRLSPRVRVHNAAAPAHTTLDSLYKYRHLDGRRFDLVLVYHGINDARANNCPPELFRDDYSHYAWYSLINDYERGPATRWLVFPYTLEFVAVKAAERLGLADYVPMHQPRADWLDYGCDVKTEKPFRTNLDALVRLARQRNQRLLLMTYAYYLPADYSEQKFKAQELDYTTHAFPVELWGKPTCVIAALEAHNRAVAALAAENPEVLFVDQNSQMPKDAKDFNDICHFTHDGCRQLVDNLLETVLGALAPTTPGAQ